MKKPSLFGDLTPAQFIREYWHKKPLLIRQAIPGFSPLLERVALFRLAAQDNVESRLITHFRQKWMMRHGPFDDLPALEKKEWTLLVQSVNLHHDQADALLRRFRFLPDARLDDLMISYASDAGGVGPHVDSYDVFLLQAHGQRRWRIGAQQDLSLVEGMPLKILRHFTPEQEFILEPGDLLYLPPHYAHEGVAMGECMTYSIGFRAPTFQELGEAFMHFMAESVDLPGRYADPMLKPSPHPAEISRAMLTQVTTELNKIQFTQDDIAIFLGQHLSEPKAAVVFDAPEKTLTAARFLQAASKKGVALAHATQMLYHGKHLYINGESFAMRAIDKPALTGLANARQLDGASVAAASKDVLEALQVWYEDGWLKLQ